MRYLAALFSILMHVLIMFFLLNYVGLSYYQSRNSLGIELVSLAEKDQVAETKPVANKVESKFENKIKNKPKHIKNSLKPDVLVRHPVQKDVPKAATRKKIATANTVAQAVGSVSDQKPIKSYPHIEIGSSSSSDAVVLRQGKGITVGNSTMVLKRGSEARSLSSLAAYEFNEDDFRGHYETFTGRQIVVIDARAEHGRLILHDRESGLIRKLRKSEYGEFIYTYGPSFNEDEPVKGTIVFLPGDEHWIHRFMWMPDGGAAEYPLKGRVDALKDDKDSQLQNFYVPAAKGRFPAVVLVRFGRDISAGQLAEVAQHLSGRDVVVLCVNELTEGQLREAYKKLHTHPKVDSKRIGVWVRSYGAKKIPRMEMPAGLFQFVILTIDHPDECLYPERLASALTDGLPTFFGFRGVSGDWKRVLPIMLTGFQSAPHQIVMIDDGRPEAESKGTDQEWIDCLSGDFVNSISAWLDSN